MNNYLTYSDSELTERFVQNDQLAFAEIYNRYFALLFQHARRLLRDDQQAEDVVQDVFTTLLEKASHVQASGNLSAYLYTITRNKIITLIRRDKVKTDYMLYLANNPSPSQAADRKVLESELAERIEREIEALPPKMRTMFEMSRNQYMSHREIAEATGTAENTVKKTLHNAITRLRSKLSCTFWLQVMSAILWFNRNF